MVYLLKCLKMIQTFDSMFKLSYNMNTNCSAWHVFIILHWQNSEYVTTHFDVFGESRILIITSGI